MPSPATPHGGPNGGASRPMTADADLLERIWLLLGGSPDLLDRVDLVGPRSILPSAFGVDALAAGTVAAAALALSELDAVRTERPCLPVAVDRFHASLAFRSERYLEPVGWELPPPWDPIAGDYPTADGWIRLHTNYSYHRAAALSVLGVDSERSAVAEAVAAWSGPELETAVVEAGGCAAALRTTQDWWEHPQGAAVAAEPLLHVGGAAVTVAGLPSATPAAGPVLAGIRVLDLTRVIAGPVCGRVLADHGASVTRIDPPGFAEVPTLLADTAAAKTMVALDLHDDADRETFASLVRDAHVVVHGYRGGAMAALGYTTAGLRALNPSVIVASLDAYGWTGPWAERRGFDSLVQMSTGIAGRQQELAGTDAPRPLPAQALDHATGYLLTAGVLRALTTLVTEQRVLEVKASLARTGHELLTMGEIGDPALDEPDGASVARHLVETTTPWGPVRRIRPIG